MTAMHRSCLLPLLLLVTACGGGGGDDDTPSSDARLSSLMVQDATLDPAFSAGTTSYTADVVWAVQSTRVTAVTASGAARLTINGTATASGTPSGPIALAVGDTGIQVVVTAEDGTIRTYHVRVTRPPPGTDANLTDLDLTAGPLDQPFDPALTSYDASLGYLAASTRVVATPADPLADGVTVNGGAAPAGQPSALVGLAVGDNPITVEVTAEDQVTTRSYDVTATRADFATLVQRAYVKATNANEGDRFGFDLALAGDRMLVGAPGEQSSATGVDGNQTGNTLNDAGAAYLYERVGGMWTAGHYLKASNTDNGDRFGWATAATDDHLVIGAPGEQSLGDDEGDNSGNTVGAVYVFDADVAGAPAQSDYLKASNPDNLDGFGTSVAAAENRILVGAPLEASNATGVNGDGTDNSLTAAGAAYLFERSGSGWTQTAYLKASNTTSGTDNQFGSAVAISGDTLAVGAWQEDSGATGIGGNQTDTSQPGSGAVYVFDRNASGSWAQTAYVKASNTATNHNFGAAVALDGDLLAVGAPGENTIEQGSGAVYVFARGSSGSWTQQAVLRPQVTGLNDAFGSDVVLDGNLLAVGAMGERSDATGINGADDNQNALDAGAVYLFERQANGAWQQIVYLKASNTDAGDLFGAAVALSGDTLGSGASAEQSNASGIGGDQLSNAGDDTGAVYVFR